MQVARDCPPLPGLRQRQLRSQATALGEDEESHLSDPDPVGDFRHYHSLVHIRAQFGEFPGIPVGLLHVRPGIADSICRNDLVPELAPGSH